MKRMRPEEGLTWRHRRIVTLVKFPLITPWRSLLRGRGEREDDMDQYGAKALPLCTRCSRMVQGEVRSSNASSNYQSRKSQNNAVLGARRTLSLQKGVCYRSSWEKGYLGERELTMSLVIVSHRVRNVSSLSQYY